MEIVKTFSPIFTLAISEGIALGYKIFSRKELCPQDSSGLVVPWFNYQLNYLSVSCTLSLEVTKMPGTPKVSGLNLTRTCFFLTGKYCSSKSLAYYLSAHFSSAKLPDHGMFFFAVNH